MWESGRGEGKKEMTIGARRDERRRDEDEMKEDQVGRRTNESHVLLVFLGGYVELEKKNFPPLTIR